MKYTLKTNYNLCDTCNNIQIKDMNIFSENDEIYQNVENHKLIIPRLGDSNTCNQKINVDFGSKYANRLIFFFASYPMLHNKKNNLSSSKRHFPGKYVDIEIKHPYLLTSNKGLKLLNNEGKANITLDCPQPYSEDDISYMSHVHFVVSDKTMTKWLDKIFTQNVLCSINQKEFKTYVKNKNRLLLDTSSPNIFNKKKIAPNAFNLYYNDIKTMSVNDILKMINLCVNDNKNIKILMKKNKLKIEELPILLYSFDSNINSNQIVALGLLRAGFSNILVYNVGNKIKIQPKSVNKSKKNPPVFYEKQKNKYNPKSVNTKKSKKT